MFEFGFQGDMEPSAEIKYVNIENKWACGRHKYSLMSNDSNVTVTHETKLQYNILEHFDSRSHVAIMTY